MPLTYIQRWKCPTCGASGSVPYDDATQRFSMLCKIWSQHGTDKECLLDIRIIKDCSSDEQNAQRAQGET